MCRRTVRALPLVMDGRSLSGRRARHLAGCLACQAEAARYRRLRRSLQAMAGHVAAAPPGFVTAVMAELDAGSVDGPGHTGLRFAAFVGGAAAALGTVAIIGWRRLRPVT